MKSSKASITALSIMLIALNSAAVAASDSPAWLKSYYQHPQPDQLGSAVLALSRSGALDGAGQPATAIGFLAGVFAQNPAMVPGWLNEFRQLPAAHQRIVAAALWYSGLPGGADRIRALAQDSSPALRAELEQMLAQTAPSLRETAVRSESSLNLQWGAFLATGEDRYILNVLAALGSSEPGLSAAARTALAEKAASHPRVYEICEAQLARQPAGVQEQLRTALAEAKSTR